MLVARPKLLSLLSWGFRCQEVLSLWLANIASLKESHMCGYCSWPDVSGEWTYHSLLLGAYRKGQHITRLAHLRLDPSIIFINRLKKGEGTERQQGEEGESTVYEHLRPLLV